jgi:hypothetical protein
MKKNCLVTDREYYYTCFYKLSSTELHDYFNGLKMVIQNKELYYNKDCEVIIPLILQNKFENTDLLGIDQRIAIKCDALLSCTYIDI